MMDGRQIWCCQCNRSSDARLVTGADIYPYRDDLAHKLFWRCRECSLFVGCHNGTTNPLGSIPTPFLREARRDVHALIEPVWKSGRMSRKQLYARLSKALGRTYHTADLRTADEVEAIRRVAMSLAGEMVA